MHFHYILIRRSCALQASLHARADVRLGLLLHKRKIKPGAVVTQWAKSKGEHGACGIHVIWTAPPQ